MKLTVGLPTEIFGIYWLLSVTMAFMVDGFWHGMLNIVFPISPMIHLVSYLLSIGAIK